MKYVNSAMSYSIYIDEHIANVEKVWLTAKSQIKEEMNIDIKQKMLIDLQVNNHDNSKKDEEEFQAYRAKFYTCEGDAAENIESNFHKAWAHHIANNPHHWDYWVTYKNRQAYPCDMDKEFIIEMLCDWTAMSIKFKSGLINWYDDNKANMILSENTKNEVERLLPYFEKVYLELVK